MERPLVWLLVLLTTVGVDWALAPAPAVAFNGREHTDVSNMAFSIALTLAEQRCTATDAADRCLCDLARNEDVLDLVSPACFAEGRTFGHLVALVDQIGGPEAYFASDQANGDLPDKVKDIDWRHIALLRRNPFANLQALHLNEGHFQDEALLRQLMWHQAAISAAGKQLASALIFEAYADHFLEDFFAPGHIVTPRASSGDMSSIAVHDKYNRRLFMFSVEPAMAKKLSKMIEIIDEVDLRDVPTGLVVSGSELEALREDLEGDDPVVAMKGDGFLKKRGKQTAFLALVAARSIFDLFESHCGAAHDGSFSGYRWKWPPVDELPVGNAIGHYDLKKSEFKSGDSRSMYLAPTDVLVSSVDLESFPRGKVQQIRPVVSLETLIATYLVPEYLHGGRRQGGEAFFYQSPSALLSGSFAWDQNYQAYGLGWRLLYPIPRLDSQLSLASGALYLTGRQSWLRTRIEIKAESGFGMLFLSFGVGYNHFIDSAQRLHSGLVLSSGASFVLPRMLLRGRLPR
jgi:hypothetical protein